ncbi:MAG: hypothetical protein P4L84_09510 [Isosphaeraceae bacterium]|nr:hypothetical protein [Isosphaeraceae bacterium]
MDPLQRIVEAAREHPFYAEGHLQGVRRFEDCPVLYKARLYRGAALALGDPDFRRSIYLSPTGGTSTGRPLYFPTDIRENQEQRARLARRLEAAGILGAASIALNLFSCGRLLRSLSIFDDFAERCGATTLPLGAAATDDEAGAAAEQFGATMVMGMPSRLTAFARWCEAQGRRFAFESVLFAGEALHLGKRRFLEHALGVRRFDAVYGSAEMGIVAYQADVTEPPVYRFPRELLHVEIGEPDGEGFGRLIVTNMVRTRHPLLRYDTGDVGRLVSEGEDELLVELRGRISDSFTIGGDYFHLREFASVLDRFAQYQITIAFDPETGADRIVFRLVAQAPAGDVERARAAEELRALLDLDDRSVAAEAIYIRPDELVYRPGTLKVPAILDMRDR